MVAPLESQRTNGWLPHVQGSPQSMQRQAPRNRNGQGFPRRPLMVGPAKRYVYSPENHGGLQNDGLEKVTPFKNGNFGYLC